MQTSLKVIFASANTTAVDVALNKGVEISIGVDWKLTGSNHILDELRVASELNEERFGGAIPSGDWVKLITTNPAKALALDQYMQRGMFEPMIAPDPGNGWGF